MLRLLKSVSDTASREYQNICENIYLYVPFGRLTQKRESPAQDSRAQLALHYCDKNIYIVSPRIIPLLQGEGTSANIVFLVYNYSGRKAPSLKMQMFGVFVFVVLCQLSDWLAPLIIMTLYARGDDVWAK